jgi:hypothetical protein
MMGDNLNHTSEQAIIRRAIENINKESKMQLELQDVVQAFLRARCPVLSKDLPTLPENIIKKIIQLGMFGARMRGTVSRDTYHNDIVTSRPSAEIGSRLGIQLAKLGQSLAVVYGHKTVGEQEYTVLKKVVLDTVPQRIEDMLRHMIRLCPTMDDRMAAIDLAKESRYPMATVGRILDDLNVLQIAERTGTQFRFYWTVSKYIRDAIREAGLYTTIPELRPRVGATATIRVLHRRVRTPEPVKPGIRRPGIRVKNTP